MFDRIIYKKATVILFDMIKNTSKNFFINKSAIKIEKVIKKLELIPDSKIKTFILNFVNGYNKLLYGDYDLALSYFSLNETICFKSQYWDNISLYYSFLSKTMIELSTIDSAFMTLKKIKKDIISKCRIYLLRMSIKCLKLYDFLKTPYYNSTKIISDLYAHLISKNIQPKKIYKKYINYYNRVYLLSQNYKYLTLGLEVINDAIFLQDIGYLTKIKFNPNIKNIKTILCLNRVWLIHYYKSIIVTKINKYKNKNILLSSINVNLFKMLVEFGVVLNTSYENMDTKKISIYERYVLSSNIKNYPKKLKVILG